MNRWYRYPLYLLGLLSLFSLARAQDSLAYRHVVEMQLPTSQTANLVGVGGSIIHDDYLSPLSYGGTEFTYLYDKIGRISKDASWINHYQGSISIGTASNPAGNAQFFSLMTDASYAAQWKGLDRYGLRGYIGPGLLVACGGIYSTRNGNNPATLKCRLDLATQILLSYRLRNRSFPALFRLDWQGSILGAAFSSEYGESYYELFLLNDGFSKGIKLTYPGNAFSQRLLLTADLPIWDVVTMRLGYSFRSLNSNLNLLQTSWHSHSLMIGVVLELRSFSGRKAMNAEGVARSIL